jgi:YD repeat-containing protein
LGFYPCSGGGTYCGTGNNGNLLSQTISFPSLSGVPALNLTQSYSYGDNLNRLTRIEEGTVRALQTYNYDGNGNRSVSFNASALPTLGLETPTSSSWFGSSNRINSWSYDGNGNVTGVGGMLRSFTYDAENRQVSATIGSATATYVYDGNGLRVSKTVGGATTTFVYDAFGNLAAEYGAAEGPSPCGTPRCYVTGDHLGSTRMLTDRRGRPMCGGTIIFPSERRF